MKNLYIFICAYILTIFQAGAQVNYTFSAASGTYTAISGGTSPLLLEADAIEAASNTDEGYANSLPIGFNFNYNGTIYSTISVNTNGFAAFALFAPITNALTQSYNVDDLSMGASGPTTVRPVVAPLWDDLDFLSATDIKYLTTGTTPNQVFTLEWSNAFWHFTSPDPAISFQLKLYETTNVIEFQYSQAGFLVDNDFAASIGITATATGTNNFLSLNNSSSSPIASSTVNTSNINGKPAEGQIYRFTPFAVTPVTLSSFNGQKKDNINVLTWLTLTEINTKGFDLQRSSDEKNFETIGFINSKATDGNSVSPLAYSFEDTRPLSSKNYYRLKQIDKDGIATYSLIIFVRGLNVTKLMVRNPYPNPAFSLLKLIIDAPANNRIRINVADIIGKTVIQEVSTVVTGANIFPLNVAKLPSGKYVIKVFYSGSGECFTTMFVKR